MIIRLNMNKHTHSLPLVFFFLVTSLLPLHTNAITVVRANIEINGIINPVDIGLFENQTPVTVSNFKSYINDGDYLNTLIYRNVPGFVIQTGGFTFDENLPDGQFIYDNILDQYNGGLQPVASKGSIINEFKLANSRGAIAMALLPDAPDSASNEWFVNLEDNIETLDILNGGLDPGFTVFGEVLSNGMDVFDQIASLDTFDFSGYHSAFSGFPTANYTLSDLSPEDLVKNNLIIINSFTEIYQITTYVNFGDTLPGNTILKDILISNTADTPLEIGSINTNAIASPFSVISNPCQNITLVKGEQCVFQVEFTMPASQGYFNNQFDIEVISENKSFTVLLTTAAPDIHATKNTIEFGLVPVFTSDQGYPEQIFPLIINRGDKELIISSITLDGVNKNEFELIDNCTTEFNPNEPGKVLPGGFCAFGINFRPTSLDEKFATVVVTSDDPDTAELVIPIHGGASSDSDGVPADIENSSPNGGDGNDDDIPDKLQSHVASFLNTDNSYTTLVTHESGGFSNVTSVQLSSLDVLPDNVTLAKGAFTLELLDIPVGSIAEFGLILPVDNSTADIYSFSSTANNKTAHWFKLEKNSIPGVVIFGDVTLNTIERNIATIRILDGGDGDADMTADGKIVFVGGPEITNSSSSGGSSGSMLWLIFIIPLVPCLLRRNQQPSVERLV